MRASLSATSLCLQALVRQGKSVLLTSYTNRQAPRLCALAAVVTAVVLWHGSALSLQQQAQQAYRGCDQLGCPHTNMPSGDIFRS